VQDRSRSAPSAFRTFIMHMVQWVPGERSPRVPAHILALVTTLIWMTFVHAETVGGCTCSGVCRDGYRGAWCEVSSFNPACAIKPSWDWCSPKRVPMTPAYCLSFLVTLTAVWSFLTILDQLDIVRPGEIAISLLFLLFFMACVLLFLLLLMACVLRPLYVIISIL